jgi:hypothetical protein
VFGPVGHGDRAYGVEPCRATRDVRPVHEPVHDRDVQQPQHEREVRAGSDLEVEPSLSCRGRGPWVDDDQRTTVVAQVGEVLHERRHRLGDVRSDQHHGTGVGDVAHREREAAVDPERPDPGRRGRRHAEPAVVVDVLRPQHHAGELPQGVCLLVGEPAATENSYRVGSRLDLDATDPGRRERQRLVPGCRLEVGVATPADQRSGEAFRRGEQVGRRPALPAETAAVAPARSRCHVDLLRARRVAWPGPHPHVDAALQGAVRTVRRHPGHVVEPVPEPFRAGFPAVSALLTRSHFTERPQDGTDRRRDNGRVVRPQGRTTLPHRGLASNDPEPKTRVPGRAVDA